jgi:hypothetical protein
MSHLRMELKVCEGCGALWIRSGMADGVYCRGCTSKLADFPAAQGIRARLRQTRVRCADVDNRRTFRLLAGGAR